MLSELGNRIGLRGWHFHIASLGSVCLCIALWIRAKTHDQSERGNAERRALFVGLWPPLLWVIGNSLEQREQGGGRVLPTLGKDATELLDIAVSDDGGVRMLRLRGELDMAGVDRFERLLSAGDGSLETTTYVVDLRELTFMDSSGLRSMIMADQRVRADGGRFVIVRGPDRVNQVLEMTGVAKHVELVDEPPA